LISEISGIDSSYEIRDELWNQICSLLVNKPKRKKKKIGRPRMDDRRAMNANSISGTYWMPVERLPRSLDAYITLHDNFQE